ncbi:MAG TPA: hypothetical protein VGM79_16685 [Streptosporangiaceae bacterium]|jgi:hypothetical protein
MTWVTWRQHRTQAMACLGLLAAVAAFAVAVGVTMRTAAGADGLTACLSRSGAAGCPAPIGSFLTRFGTGVNTTAWAVLILLPGLAGVVVGAPLLGRELETGTWRLAWSQTVPRTRWLVSRLALVTGGLVVLGAAMTAVITWYRAPMDRLTGHFAYAFDYEGVAATCYLLCAFGLAVLAGLLLRNSIGAMVAAFVPWLVIRGVIEAYVRPYHFLAPLHVQVACPASSCDFSTNALPPYTGHAGDWQLSVVPRAAHLVVTYQPAGRFWPLQLIEGGLFLVLAAAALGAAVWLLHRRTS